MDKEIIALLDSLSDAQIAALKAAVPAVDETAAVEELNSAEKITVKVTSGKASCVNFAEVRHYCGSIAAKFLAAARVGYDVRSKVDEEGDGKTIILVHKTVSVLTDSGISEVVRLGIAADARALAKACGIQCGDCSTLESARKSWNAGVGHIRKCVKDNGAYNPKKVLDAYCNAAAEELKVMVNDLADCARQHFKTNAPKAWSALLGKEVPAFHEGDKSSEMMKVLRVGRIKSEIKTGMKASRQDDFTDQ